MGGARNLKLGATGGKDQGTGEQYVLCRSNLDIIQLLCASKRCSAVAGSRG